MDRKLGALPFLGRELCPQLAQCGLDPGLLPHQVPSSSIQPFDHNRHGPKIGGFLLLFGRRAGSPSSTMWTGPRPSSILDPSSRLATIDMGQKLGAPPPFWKGGWVPIQHKVPWAEAYIHTKWHLDASSRLATIEMGRKLGRGSTPFVGGG